MPRFYADAMISGVGQRMGKDNRLYHTLSMFVQGEDGGNMDCSLPHDKPEFINKVKGHIGKVCKVTVNIRNYKGTSYTDCIAIEPKG